MAKQTINIPGILIITLPMTIKEYFQAFFAHYDNKIMDELLHSPRFITAERKRELAGLNPLKLRILKGSLVVAGAYEIYLQNRDQFKVTTPPDILSRRGGKEKLQ